MSGPVGTSGRGGAPLGHRGAPLGHGGAPLGHGGAPLGHGGHGGAPWRAGRGQPGQPDLPDWLAPLAGAVAEVTAADLSRHHQPEPGLAARHSAVLMAFRDTEDGPGLLLLKRADDLRHHAGQVAFPGGASDPTDLDAAATALREAEEEVGVDPATVEVVAALPTLFLPPSRFLVTPVLAWWVRPHPVRPVDLGEVADVAVLPVGELADPANRFTVRHPSGYLGAGFETRGWFVWGFTAGLVDRLLELGGWARSWDSAKMRTVPA